MTGDGRGRHVSGTPDVYTHGWKLIAGTGVVSARDRIKVPSHAAEPHAVIGQYAGWRAGLTDSEDKALRFYQSPGFALMNGQLRGVSAGKLKSDEHASDADLKRAAQASRTLTAAIAKAPPLKQGTTVYRGFDAGQFGELAPGKVITDKGFTSTSVSNDAGAVGRAAQAGQMELTLPAGTKAGAGSVRELILPPGSSMRVTSVTKKGGVTHVKAELLLNAVPT
jgi:ADP-ribosyltransferase exoenzyme